MKHIARCGVAGAAVLYLTACSGGNRAFVPIDPSGDFLVIRTEPTQNGTAYLNDRIAIDLTLPVDLETANLDSVAFQTLDVFGNPTTEPVTGRFLLDKSPGDAGIGRRLVFEPSLPRANDYSDGGLRAGRTYLVQLVGGDRHNGTALRSASGRPLAAPMSFSFATVEGTSAAQLFRNPLAGGPRRARVDGLTISGSTPVDDVGLNLFGAPPVELRLAFDQALNPHDGNVPVRFDTDPLVRREAERGRIYLEYDDPEFGPATWIPADVELERNDSTGATVVLRPVGVLPNGAGVRVIVEAELEDIAAESNVGNLAYDRVFGAFRTEDAYGQQWNGIVERFVGSDRVDFDAVFAEPVAEVGPGYVRAGFEFEGSSTTLDYQPTANEIVLNTSHTQVVPAVGLPFNVSGGVFKFRNVTIPQGVNVRGQGPNPMVWLCTGDFRVHGTLSVRGGDGERVNTLNSANFAKGGGIGACGGGNGGDGSPSSTARSPSGATGNGPMQTPGQGGGGGLLSCLAGCMNGDGGGSGGGGGTLATQGDPWFRSPALTGTGFQQRGGRGGAGCSGTAGSRSAALAGGDPAPVVFTDSRADNDFFGVAIDRNRNVRIRGELLMPVGGGGGGGGGDHSYNAICGNDPQFANDASGGGGGGGGGVLIIKALGEIEVTGTGRITADGGHGGGGAWAGSCNRAGGGGGGAGGMVILMSSARIVLHAHGSATRWNYAQNDYDFCVSADGGVCTTGGYAPTGQATVITHKYPGSGQPVVTGQSYDLNPLGGFGGMGVVQLMAPIGLDNADQTNTYLDDNITVLRDGIVQQGLAKQAILAWRGFPDETGTFRDDFGAPVAIGLDEGDIRPAPRLLPAPFGARSRARSKWIDTGASRRRPLSAPDGLPRGLVLGGGSVVGPVYEFDGLEVAGATAGYVRHVPAGPGAVRIDYPEVVAPVGVASATPGVEYRGQSAYAIELQSAALGDVADRYRQYEAELLDVANTVVGSHRILGHSDRALWLDPGTGVLAGGVVAVRVLAKFFRLETRGSEGLGPLVSGTATPRSNVRIGFAFHQEPGSATAPRYPADPQGFVYRMDDPGLAAWIQQYGQPRFVQWDVMFDLAFGPGQSASPDSPRPELDWLRIPFRF